MGLTEKYLRHDKVYLVFGPQKLNKKSVRKLLHFKIQENAHPSTEMFEISPKNFKFMTRIFEIMTKKLEILI